VALGPARQNPKTEGSVRLSTDDHSQSWRHLVVTNDEIVTRLGVEREPRMTEVCGDDARLVLLVVIDPKLDDRLRGAHTFQGTTHRAG
jgi:hypothetical protein